MASYYSDIIEALKEAGWTYDRPGRGSHEIWAHKASGKKQSVPYDCEKKHTANGILKFAGLPKRF